MAAKWKYNVVKWDPSMANRRGTVALERRLNEEGTEGWELVEAALTHGPEGERELVFKRPDLG